MSSSSPPSKRSSSAPPRTSTRPPSLTPRPPSTKPPRRHEERLDDALADAEKMARRVEKVEEQDPFAASLLALEYLARTQQADVNPLEQRGRTDAWTSAFVRLRLAADKGKKYPGFESDAHLYVAARAEERRLNTLLGRDVVTELARARGDARRTRRRRAAMLGAAILAPILAAFGAAYTAATHGPYARESIIALGVATLVANALVFRLVTTRGAVAKSNEEIAHLERALRERGAFEASPTGRFVIQKLHDEHPLLIRNVSAPPGRAQPR